MHVATNTLTYSVLGMTCGHCVASVRGAVGKVDGVHSVEVNLDSKVVVVTGTDLDSDAILAAIDEAGFDAVV
jgi:copper chaperone